MAKYQVNLLYKDASNYKTGINLIVDSEEYPEIVDAKVEDTWEMGEFGTESESLFFSDESEYHGHEYDSEIDHNLLTVKQITKL